MDSKTCGKCEQSRPLDAFNKNAGKKDGLQTQCRGCQRKGLNQYYQDNKEVLRGKIVAANKVRKQEVDAFVREKKSAPCTDCGERYPWYVMDFDHLDASTKDRDVAQMLVDKCGLDKVRREVEKCEVVCSNCHRERTYKRRIAINA